MRLMTNLEIHKEVINFKTNHTRKDYKYFDLKKYEGWIKKGTKKYPVYSGICKQCNQEVMIPITLVYENKIKSCGCSKIKNSDVDNKKQDIANPAFNKLYQSYKKKAEDRKLQFSLDKEAFFKLTQDSCYYCNSIPYQIFKSRKRELKFNGVDRLNNKVGYTDSNSVSCCGKCNMMKWKLTEKDFLNQVILIYDNMASGHNKFDKFGEKLKQVNTEPSVKLTINEGVTHRD